MSNLWLDMQAIWTTDYYIWPFVVHAPMFPQL